MLACRDTRSGRLAVLDTPLLIDRTQVESLWWPRNELGGPQLPLCFDTSKGPLDPRTPRLQERRDPPDLETTRYHDHETIASRHAKPHVPSPRTLTKGVVEHLRMHAL